MRFVRWAWVGLLLLVALTQFAIGNILTGFMALGGALVASPFFTEGAQKQLNLKVPTWAAIVGSLVLFFIGAGFMTKKPPAQPAAQSADTIAQTPSTTAEATAPDDTVIRTTDLLLSRAYSANEVAAQKKYGDKTLWVKGVVTGVELDLLSNAVVKMRGVNEFLPTEAKFDDSDKDRISNLNRGDLITMQCTEIMEVISMPILSDCSLMDNSVK